MNKTWIKNSAIVISLILTVCLFPKSKIKADVVASGDCGVTGDNLTWTFDDSTGTLTISGEGNMANMEDVDNAPWNEYRSRINEIVVEENVISIGDYAFWNCSNLTSVTLPEGVLSIGNSAFYTCTSLASIEIPESVSSIGTAAFSGCANLTSIEIPHNVNQIKNYTFRKCSNLTYVSIPDSVTTIGFCAFDECSSLSSVIVNKSAYSIDAFPDLSSDIFHYYYDVSYTNDGHGSVDGKTRTYGADQFELLFEPDSNYRVDKVVWSNGTDSVELFSDTNGVYSMPDSDTSATIHATFTQETTLIDSGICGVNTTWSLDSDGLLIISGEGKMYNYQEANIPWAQYRDRILKVAFTGNVTTIGRYAFGSCPNLTEISIPENITSIETWAFARNPSLTSIILPDGITEIADCAFFDCTGLQSITIPDGVTYIGRAAFSGCSDLVEVNIPSSVTAIYDEAFYGCTSLSSIIIPESVTSIGSIAFMECSNLTFVVLDRNAYNSAAFSGVSYEALHYYIDLKYDNDSRHGTITGPTRSFETDVVEFTISPDDGFELDKLLWYGATGVIELSPEANGKYTIPVMSTSYGVLYAMFRRTDYSYACGSDLTWELNGNTLIISGSGDMYDWDDSIRLNKVRYNRNAAPWSEYKNEIQSVVFNGNVTSIGDYAFAGCTNLSSIMIPEGVMTIGRGSFSECTGLVDVSLPESLVTVGKSAFISCTSLLKIEIPNGVITIDKGAFAQCTSLISIEIPDGVTFIGGCAFSGCTQLKEVNIPDSVVLMEDQTFYNCENLETVILPKTIESIDQEDSYWYNMFHGCSSLKKVIIPNGVILICEGTFWGCASLESVVLPDSDIVVYNNTFNGCEKLNNIVLNKSSYTDAVFSAYPTGTLHYYYDMSYSDNGFGTVTGITRTYGTDEIELSITPDDNYEINKVVWTNGTETIELISDANGLYVMPDSETDAEIQVIFATVEEKDFTISPIEDETYTGFEIIPIVRVFSGAEQLAYGTDFTVSYSNNVNVGTATVTVTGIGEYTGTQSTTFHITAKSVSDILYSPIEYQTYTGSPLTPSLDIRDGDKTLISGTDYTVAYSNNINVGEGTATITGKGNYTGTASNVIVIIPKSVSGVAISPISSQTYTGSNITPAFTVKDGNRTLVAGTDYTVSYSNNVNVGTATITITGKGNYTGSKSTTFQISTKHVSGLTVSSVASQTYTGSQITPSVTVKDGNKTLVSGKDYTVSYSNNVRAGTATITITGKGNYSGTKSSTFQISAKSVSGVAVSSVSSQMYTGSKIMPAITVKDGSKSLAAGTDYTVTYSNNVNVGTATITVTGKGNYTGSKSTTFQISTKSVSGLTVSSVASQTYTGSQITPVVTVKDGNRTLVAGTDYTVTYSNNVNAGTATVTITGKGNYAGTRNVSFTIVEPELTYTWAYESDSWYLYDNFNRLTTGFARVNGVTYYMNESGVMVTGWQLINYDWYYFNNSGAMETGWLYSGGDWYYLAGDGKMITGFQTIGGVKYYLSGSGAMVTGWQCPYGDWYYFNSSGAMETGWLYSGGDWYYLASDGKMLTGFQTIGGVKYYLSGSGAMVSGWQYLYGDWYYFNSSGATETGWLYSGGDWYYLGGDGKMLTGFQSIGGETYYLSSSGAMVTGWKQIGGNWYYFYSSGAMARSGNVNSGSKSYNFDSNGVCTNPYSDTPVYSYEYVWIPQTGKKYHTSSSCSGMNNPTRVTLSDAKSLGYTACQKCCY